MIIRQDALQTSSASSDSQLICFKLGEEEYGVYIIHIKEVIKHQKIMPLPKAPSFVEGVINLRGMVIPIVDLRKRFGLPAEVNRATKIIIVQVGNRILGLVVDDVTDIITLPHDSLLPPPKMIKGEDVEYLDGVVNISEGGLLFILSIDKILTAEEKNTLTLPLH